MDLHSSLYFELMIYIGPWLHNLYLEARLGESTGGYFNIWHLILSRLEGSTRGVSSLEFASEALVLTCGV